MGAFALQLWKWYHAYELKNPMTGFTTIWTLSVSVGSGSCRLCRGRRHNESSRIFKGPADAFPAAVMIREPERKKEPEKRRPAGKLSPWS